VYIDFHPPRNASKRRVSATLPEQFIGAVESSTYHRWTRFERFMANRGDSNFQTAVQEWDEGSKPGDEVPEILTRVPERSKEEPRGTECFHEWARNEEFRGAL
jgi:hypothetical protein